MERSVVQSVSVGYLPSYCMEFMLLLANCYWSVDYSSPVVSQRKITRRAPQRYPGVISFLFQARLQLLGVSVYHVLVRRFSGPVDNPFL
mmetsp:Transcript_12907/g.22528  ORF Transcript_12907/g.22528 Transcript_12907/m.22528 type:complete len:89 (+) Transcript_12907:299-565(+)